MNRIKGMIKFVSLFIIIFLGLIPVSQAYALDYNDPDNWAYLGTEEDRAVDVFFIAPTNVMGDENKYLADLENEGDRNSILASIGMQTGIYNENGRFYSPYYSQITMAAYELDAETRETYLETAYAEVKAAFDWYMENKNEGRPFIIAGFSQGADHGLRLLKEYGATADFQNNLVAAYLIGWAVTDDDLKDAPYIKLAQGETDTGVIITFDCEADYVDDTIIVPKGTKTYSINPLNWKTDSTIGTKEENLGFVYPKADGSVKKEIPNLCGAYIDSVRGTLKVTDVTAEEYPARLSIFPEGSYHIYDYEFFYRNLQENVKVRTQAFFEDYNYNDFVIEDDVLLKYVGLDEDIVIPNGVKKIGNSAFYGNKSIKSVTVSDSVLSVESFAFYACSGLEKIVFTGNLDYIGYQAFFSCARLKSVVLQNSDIFIDGYAFKYTPWVNNIQEVSSLKIYNGILFQCEQDATSVYIPESVVSIASEAFEGCDKLKELVIPDSVRIIGQCAFLSCTKLEKLQLPEELEQMGGATFVHCKKLKEIKLPGTLKCIKEGYPLYGVSGMFYGCESLTQIIIPDGVEEISYDAFGLCSKLTSLVIPSSVKSIGNVIFEDCEQKIDICYLGTEDEWQLIDTETDFDDENLNVEIHYNHGDTITINEIILQPTCTENGASIDNTYCSVCNMLLSSELGEVVKKTGHTVVIDKAVAASYSKTGLTAGKHCKVCGKVLKAQKVVAKKTLSVPKVLYAKNSAKSKIFYKWNSVKDATGYQIYVTVGKTTKKITVKASKADSIINIITNLKKGKTYSVKIRAYKKIGAKTYYSAWSTVKKITIKK